MDTQDTEEDAFTDLKEYIEEQSFLKTFNWRLFSGNPNDTAVSYLIDEHPEKIDFELFSGNTNDVAVEYLITHHPDKIYWEKLYGNSSEKAIDFLLRNAPPQKFDRLMEFLLANPNPRFVDLVPSCDSSFIRENRTLMLNRGDNPNIAFCFPILHSSPLTHPCEWNWQMLSKNPNDEIVETILLPNMERVSYPHLCSNSNDKIVDILLSLDPMDPRIDKVYLCLNKNPRVLPLMMCLTGYLHYHYLSKNPVIFVSSYEYVLK